MMFETMFPWPKEAPHSAFQAMENENNEDDSHFDAHSSVSSSQMGPVEEAEINFLQLCVDDSLSGPERVQVFQVSMKELEVGKSNLLVDSSQLARPSTSKQSRQIEILRAFDDSQPLDDTWSLHSVSTISGMPSLFDQEVDENIPVSVTLPSTVGANITSSSTYISQDEKESRFHVLLWCLWNGDKSPSGSGERRPRRAAWFRQLPLFAKIGVVMFAILFVVSIVTIAVSVADNNNKSDPPSTGSVEISATSPTDLSIATPVASFTDSPTSSPVYIPTASLTTTNTLSTAIPVASLTDSPTSSPVSIPTASPTTTKNLSTTTPVAPLTNSPTTSPVSIPTASPTTTKNLSTATLVAPLTDIPTTSPVSIPKVSPTTTICVDDTVATFVANRVTRDCAWLSESLALQVLLCRPGEGAFEFCRETCNNCPTQKPHQSQRFVRKL